VCSHKPPELFAIIPFNNPNLTKTRYFSEVRVIKGCGGGGEEEREG
jgi:hypothetical protein